jgi:hypothetical protein
MRAARPAAALLALVLLAAGCSAPPLPGDAVALSAHAVDLGPPEKTADGVGRLAFRGAVALSSPDLRFGGYSALQVSADGDRLIALSDKGHVLRARLRYDAAMLTGADDAAIGALAGPDGAPVAGTRAHDAEALTRDGADLVAGFEGPARLWRYAGGALDAAPAVIPLPAAAARLPGNRSVEAVAALGGGRFLVLAEAPPALDRPSAWIGGASGWRAASYARTGLFVPVDAAMAANGDVIVLERRFTWVGGLASRLVRIPAAQLAGDTLHPEELALIEPPLATENFEGLALRPGPAGETLIYLISDDNFHPMQRTLLALFALAP